MKTKHIIQKLLLFLIAIFSFCLIENINAAVPSTITYVSPNTFMPKNSLIFDQNIVGQNTTLSISNASGYQTKILTNTYSGVLTDVIYQKQYFMNYASAGLNKFIYGTSSDWLVTFPSGLNSKTTITLNYPYVGTYNGVQIGCKMTISNIVQKQYAADWSYASFHIARDIHRGIRMQNVLSADFGFTFYNRNTGANITLSNTMMSFSSLNYYEKAQEKVAPLTDVKTVYALNYPAT